MFSGLSELRKKDKEKESEQDNARKQYLQRYMSGPSAPKKKKKRDKSSSSMHKVRIVDDEAHPMEPQVKSKDDDEEDGLGPAIANQEEYDILLQQQQQQIQKQSQWRDISDSKPPSSVEKQQTRQIGSRQDQFNDQQKNGKIKRHDSDNDDDLIVSRKRGRQRYDSDDDQTARQPPHSGRLQRGSEDDDLTVQRRPGKSAGSSRRHDSDSDDLAVPRKTAGRRESDSDSDVAVPRKQGGDGSKRVAPKRYDSDSDDLAVPRKQGGDGGKRGAPKRHDSDSDDLAVPRKQGGERTGDRGKEQRAAEGGGGGPAEQVYRIGQRRVSKSEWLDHQQTSKNKKKRRSKEELYDKEGPVWGGGLKQQAQQAGRRRSEAEAASSSWYKQNVSQEIASTHQHHDPMAWYMQQDQQIKGERGGPQNEDKGVPSILEKYGLGGGGKGGFNIPQDVPAWSWKRRKVPAALNRFDIVPGRHWDGVDRGNGFEKELFKIKADNKLKARQRQQEDLYDI